MKRLKLGVTGGIGSGKTSVCRVFSVLGIPVFSADIRARDIMETDEAVIEGLNEIAGKNLYHDHRLDREVLAALIFNDREKLLKVNSLVHPAVFRQFELWFEEQVSAYSIMEAAILFESGGADHVDLRATVIAPEEERISRVIRRNSLTRDQVVERMRNQMDDNEKIRLSDYLIRNSESDMIIPAVLAINEDILHKITA